MAKTLTTIPETIIQGDTPSWPVFLPDYSASDGWTLYCKMVNTAGINTITAAANGADYQFAPTAAQTAAWQPGNYQYQYYVERGAGANLERATVGWGALVVGRGFAATTVGTDTRSHVRKVLDAIEAVIEGRATRGDQEMTVDGTTIKKMTAEQLIAIHSRYTALWQQEQQTAKLNNGAAGGGRLLMRL